MFVKKQSAEDKFFSFGRKATEESMIQRFFLLSKMNGKDYSAEMMRVKSYYADNYLSDAEAERLDNMIVSRFFDDSYKLKVVWKRTDPLLRVLSIALVLCIACLFTLGVGGNVFEESFKKSEGLIGAFLIMGFILFPIGLLLGGIFQGFYNMLLSFLYILFPSVGSLSRTTITLDRFWQTVIMVIFGAIKKPVDRLIKDEGSEAE
ncbi:MAG: hypothetical protein P8H59_04275 [Flavobacteriales bacterium]|nr:hypothetical protein [Flavobacteriales bacterium]MDG1780145.1 hypothetical protein [Flavobacteriales bacterium]MDG2245259.1 hypothetical protein [Flavobacteriales bacterium]